MKDRSAYTMKALMEGPAVLTIEEAGRYLGLARSAAYAAAKSGVLPTIKVGKRRVVVAAAHLAALLDRPSS